MNTGAATGGTAQVSLGADQALFVYGVLRVDDADGVLRPLTGLDGEEVRLVRAGSLAAAVSDMGLDRPPGRRAELLAYQGVLDVLAAAEPVVPIRFGSVMADEDAIVEELLLPQEGQLAVILDELVGRHQYNLRATYVEDAVLADLVRTEPEIRRLRDHTRRLPKDAGYADRAQLGELVFRAMQERSAYDATVLLDAIDQFVVECLLRTPPSATQLVDAALLVDDARSEELADRLEDLAEAVHDRIRLRLVGPLAAYDFVGESTWD